MQMYPFIYQRHLKILLPHSLLQLKPPKALSSFPSFHILASRPPCPQTSPPFFLKEHRVALLLALFPDLRPEPKFPLCCAAVQQPVKHHTGSQYSGRERHLSPGSAMARGERHPSPGPNPLPRPRYMNFCYVHQYAQL